MTMSIPDGSRMVDWLTAIQKIVDWRTEAALATTAAIVLMLAGNNVRWFEDVPSLYLVVAAVVGLFCVLHMLICLVDYLRKSVLESRKGRVRCKFSKLSDSQKELLTRIYRNRNRKFLLETEYSTGNRYPLDPLQQKWHNQPEIPRLSLLPEARELEELIQYNYIESGGKFALPRVYSVTENGWRELEKYLIKSI